ncbi:MAG: sulfotransferase domain-containing protein, partial [Pseudohongiellaceae bacterium]
LFVGRDARDVAWSMYHHQQHLTDMAYDTLNSHPDRVGPQFCRADCDEREYYLHFLQNGYFPGFSPDLQFWPTIQSWWDARDKPNVMLLHYNNLKMDFEGEARRIATFLQFDTDESLWPDIVRHCSIDHMRKVAGKLEMMDMIFEGGGNTFINKGTNGRWKDVLSEEEIARCDKVAAEHLSPECADWLRTGQML